MRIFAIDRIIVGAGWGILGAVISRLLIFSLNILFVRLLSREDYGYLVLIQSTISVGVVFGAMGLSVTATKLTAQYIKADPGKLARLLTAIRIANVLMSLLIASSLIVFSDKFSKEILNSDSISPLLRLGCVALIFVITETFCAAVLLGLEATKEIATSSVLSILISLPIQVLLTLEYQLSGSIIGIVISSIVQCAISHSFVKQHLAERDVKYFSVPHKKDLVEVFSFGAPAFFASIVVMPTHWLCNVILVDQLDGVREVAILGVMMQIFQIAVFLPTASGKIFLPILSEMEALNQRTGLKKLLTLSVIANIIFFIPILIAGFWWGGNLLNWYGPDFTAYHFHLLITLFGAFLVAAQGPIGSLMIASNNVWNGFFMNLLWAILYVGMAWNLRVYGALGILFALLFAYLIQFCWAVSFSRKFLRINRF